MDRETPPGATFEQAYFEATYRDYELQNPPRKIEFYRLLAERATQGIASPCVLDAGCAFGKFLSALGSRWRRFGTDLSAYALERARRDVPDARFALAGAAARPFEVAFDLITAFDVLEHVEDLDAVSRTLHASLRPGGRLLFVVPVYDGPTGPLIHLLDRDPTHVHKRSRWFWLDWAMRMSHVEEWRGIYRYLLPGGYYVHLPTTTLRRLTPAIAVLAQRR